MEGSAEGSVATGANPRRGELVQEGSHEGGVGAWRGLATADPL